MKKTVLVFSLLLMAAAITAQEINPLLYEATWMENESRDFNGYRITKIFGELPDNASTYNYSPLTAIGYKPLTMLEDNFKEVAEAAHWTEEQLTENLNNLKTKDAGGQLQIYLTRYTEDRANFQWFFIVIRGEKDKGKLWEYDIPYQAPQVPVQLGWWNYTTVDIPIELPDKFYVYLNDKKSQFLSDFKFLVEKIK
ncbi:MAG: hypothetical protein KKF98_11355 [Bacteroidetes bacterium]|jgi:hypothetical protein|nr:hypothetical protein [Bacteroidota bacterium]